MRKGEPWRDIHGHYTWSPGASQAEIADVENGAPPRLGRVPRPVVPAEDSRARAAGDERTRAATFDRLIKPMRDAGEDVPVRAVYSGPAVHVGNAHRRLTVAPTGDGRWMWSTDWLVDHPGEGQAWHSRDSGRAADDASMTKVIRDFVATLA